MTTPNENIPVKVGGVEVGTARIGEDGAIDLILEPNQFGRDVCTGVRAGIVTGLTIRPVRRTANEPGSDNNVRPLRDYQGPATNDNK